MRRVPNALRVLPKRRWMSLSSTRGQETFESCRMPWRAPTASVAGNGSSRMICQAEFCKIVCFRRAPHLTISNPHAGSLSVNTYKGCCNAVRATSHMRLRHLACTDLRCSDCCDATVLRPTNFACSRSLNDKLLRIGGSDANMHQCR